MKTKKVNFGGNPDWRALLDSLISQIEHLNPLPLIGIGAVTLLVSVVLVFTGGASPAENETTLKRADQVMDQVSGHVQNFRRVL